MSEKWVNIEGYEGIYQITRSGKVRSLDKVVNCYPKTKRTVKGRTLKPILGKIGYYYFQLSNNKSVRKSKYLHRLLALTFISNPNNYPCINHKDGNKRNNSLSNLEWCTHQQNMAHGFRTGLVPKMINVKGEKGFSAKLKDRDVMAIKKRLKNGERIIDIAKDYPIKEGAISEIKAGRSWGHIEL